MTSPTYADDDLKYDAESDDTADGRRAVRCPFGECKQFFTALADTYPIINMTHVDVARPKFCITKAPKP